jgi:hypothetical protein
MVSDKTRDIKMALEYEITSLDSLDETLHSFYTPTADGSKYVLDVAGVKPLSEFTKVQGALEKERNDHKQVKAKLSHFGELDPESVQAQLARIAELEELAKGSTVDVAKLEEMANARAKSQTQPLMAERDAISKKAAELEQRVAYFEQVDRQRRMNDEFVAKIKAAKIDPRFEETVLMKAERLFTETDDGKFLTKDGINGVTGYMPFEVWLSEQQASNPYYWGDNVGGGAKGGNGAYKGNNPFATGNLTEQAQMWTENPTLAERLSKQAK